MKPTATIYIPKNIQEDSIAHIMKKMQIAYTGIQIVYKLSDEVTVPSVFNFNRNGIDLGNIDKDLNITSITLFRAMKNQLNEAYKETL